MLNTSFSPWPSFSEEEAEAVKSVLLSNKVNYWTGEESRCFEREFSDWTGAKYAIALANGTLALDVALKALGVGRGDDVIVTPRTFLASVSCVVNAGARPIFADVDPDSQNITADSIRSVLTPATKAVICVHLAGWSCDMDPIMELANERDFYVIEDCAQAHGARYKGRSVGTIGHIGAWSFCQDKIMTTGGEGGMVTTNDKTLWSAMWSYKDHGKSYDAIYNREHPPGFRWVHESFGTNFRMLEMQAVIGRIQLKRMDEWQKARSRNMLALTAACSGHGVLRIPVPSEDLVHAGYRLYGFVNPDELQPGWTRDRIVNAISANGVPCFQGSCSEVYLEKAFDNTGLRPIERLSQARLLGETSVAFLVHPTLTDAEIAKAQKVIAEVLVEAGGMQGNGHQEGA